MDFAPDWLSVVNLCLTAILGWKTLGPRRKTKLRLMLGREHEGPEGAGGGYRTLIVMNQGHYPANGVYLEHVTEGGGGMSMRPGDILPWQMAKTGFRFRNYENDHFMVTYRDADNKLIRKRLPITPGEMHSRDDDKEEISAWIARDEKLPPVKRKWPRIRRWIRKARRRLRGPSLEY